MVWKCPHPLHFFVFASLENVQDKEKIKLHFIFRIFYSLKQPIKNKLPYLRNWHRKQCRFDQTRFFNLYGDDFFLLFFNFWPELLFSVCSSSLFKPFRNIHSRAPSHFPHPCGVFNSYLLANPHTPYSYLKIPGSLQLCQHYSICLKHSSSVIYCLLISWRPSTVMPPQWLLP